MKILYLECGMGAAGDMLMAALLDLLPKPEEFLHTINHIGLPHTTVAVEADEKCGIAGKKMVVTVAGIQEHSQDVSHTHAEKCAHTHSHEHPHAHSEECAHTHNHEHPHAHSEECAHTHSHEHPHAHSEECAHTHSHEHPHTHGEEYAHTHSHEHPHAHSEGSAHTHSHEHSHATLASSMQLLQGLALPPQVIANATAVYTLLAKAEASAHGTTMEQIHFHEVGTLDALADIVGVCLLVDMLGVQQIVASPVHVGSGFVRCAHGVLPVPAPATAALLQGVPTYGGTIQGELCTPTGAALLKHFVSSYGPQPVMVTKGVGYGTGSKSFPVANFVRAFLGEADAQPQPQLPTEAQPVLEIACNLDDITGEELGFAMEVLLQAGALDVYFQPIQMKKNRPAYMLCCLCHAQQQAQLVQLIMRHTSTLGVRVYTCQRHVLARQITPVQTPLGTVRFKSGSGHGTARQKPEFEDIAALARAQGVSLREVTAMLPDAPEKG